MAAKKKVGGGISGIPDATLLRDAYFGDGGFADGTYLEPHKRERAENYESRKNQAYYLNYVAPVVNSHVDPVFKIEAKRDWVKTDLLFAGFDANIDKAGTTLKDFVKEAAILAKLTGVTFIVVDNDKLEEGQTRPTVAQALLSRSYPYAYIVQRDQVKHWKRDRFGRLVEFSYTEDDADNDSDESAKLQKRERGWTETEWYVKDETGTITERGPNLLGRLPVIPMYGRKVKNKFMPRSEFYSCARANTSIYNLCSKLDQIISDVTFPLLKYPKVNVGELTIGTGNAIGWDGTANAAGPSYIAPPSEPANVIMSQIDRLIKEIYRMAVLSHVMGVEQKASGIAKEWDFERTNEVLSACADTCQRTELAIVELYEAWMETKLNYTVIYPDDFGVKDKTETVDRAGKALDLGIGGEFDKAVKKDVAATLFQKLTDEEQDTIKDEIDLTEAEPRKPVTLFPAGGTSLQDQTKEPKEPAKQQAK